MITMSDLFHKDVPFDFVDKVMAVIKETPQHRYQLLTKRADRMEEYFKTREVPKNVWIGVTVEVQSSKGMRQMKHGFRGRHCRDSNLNRPTVFSRQKEAAPSRPHHNN